MDQHQESEYQSEMTLLRQEIDRLRFEEDLGTERLEREREIVVRFVYMLLVNVIASDIVMAARNIARIDPEDMDWCGGGPRKTAEAVGLMLRAEADELAKIRLASAVKADPS